MVIIYNYCKQILWQSQTHAPRWWFRWPWRHPSTVPIALTYASCSVLQFKPLNAAIGQVLAQYYPGNRLGPIQTSKNTIKTNASHLLAISMAKAMRWYGTKRIDQCIVLSASIKATGHRNRSSIHSVSPLRPPGSHSNKKQNTIKQQNKHQDQAKKRQMYCLLYFPRANISPEIDGHTNSTLEYNYQLNHLHLS